MTKKTEQKKQVKGADAEQKVLNKIQHNSKAAQDKTTKSKVKDKENQKTDSAALGKRPHASKTSGSASGTQPVMNRRQKQRISDLIKKLRVSINRILPHHSPVAQLGLVCLI